MLKYIKCCFFCFFLCSLHNVSSALESEGISQIYTTTVYNNLRPLHANWEPGKPVELGDYGFMQGRTFIREGNIRLLGINFNKITDSTKDRKYFSSAEFTDVKFNAKGSIRANGVAYANATLEISFSGKGAVFFNAADCTYSMIESKTALGSEIMQRYENNKWNEEWAIVTDIVNAGSTIVAVSGGDSSSLVLEASGDAKRINLANASIGLNIVSEKNVGFQLVTHEGIIPLIGLSQLQRSFWSFWSYPWDKKRNFQPILSETKSSAEHLAQLVFHPVSRESQEEHLESQLFFRQLE